MKKSVVATSACWLFSFQTAASSAVSMPTRSASGTGIAAAPRRIDDSTPGAILQPQPPPCDSEVRRGSSGITSVSVAVIGSPPVPAR